ncbi:hypothetical protein KCA24_36170, partial [Escherichia coli]|nr:hypothetical protein [Escherichia coli]
FLPLWSFFGCFWCLLKTFGRVAQYSTQSPKNYFCISLMKDGVEKKYTVTLLIAALLLTGCDSDEERAIDLVEKDIRSTLLDPDAGRLPKLRAIQLGVNSYSLMEWVE